MMKQRRFTYTWIAALIVVGISLIVVATPAWAAMTHWLGGLFRAQIPNAEGEMLLTSEFTPLYPTYVPESFYASGTLSGGELGSQYTELRYNSNDHFVILYEIQLQGDEILPDGQPTTVSGHPAVLQTGMAGTAQLIGGAQEGRPPGSGGGGGGGGASSDSEPLLFPETIDYTDGRQLVWFAEGLYIELLTNLPEAELVKIAESLVLAEEVPPEEIPTLLPPVTPPSEPLAEAMNLDPAKDFMPFAPSYLPADLVILEELTILDEQGAKIIEARHFGFDRFLIIEMAIDQGEDPGDGKAVMVAGQPAVLITGLSGTALFNVPVLQDGTASASHVGMGGGSSVPDISIYPSEITYENGSQLIWVQGTLRIKLLTNLSQDEMFKVAESLVPLDG